MPPMRDGDGDGRIFDGTSREAVAPEAGPRSGPTNNTAFADKVTRASSRAARSAKAVLGERYGEGRRPGEMRAAYTVRQGMKALADVERIVGPLNPSSGVIDFLRARAGVGGTPVGFTLPSDVSGMDGILDTYSEVAGLATQDAIERLKAMDPSRAREVVRGAMLRAKRLLGIMAKMEGRLEPDTDTLALAFMVRHGMASQEQAIALAMRLG